MGRLCNTHGRPLTLYTPRHARFLCSGCLSRFPNEYFDSICIAAAVKELKFNDTFEKLISNVKELSEVIDNILKMEKSYQSAYNEERRYTEAVIEKKLAKMVKYKRFQNANRYTDLSEMKAVYFCQLQSAADHYLKTLQKLENLNTRINDLLRNVSTSPHNNEDVCFYIADIKHIHVEIKPVSKEVYPTKILYNNTGKIASCSLGELYVEKGQCTVDDLIESVTGIGIQNVLFRRRFKNQPEIILFRDHSFNRVSHHVAYSDRFVVLDFDDDFKYITQYRIDRGTLCRYGKRYHIKNNIDISVINNSHILVCQRNLIETLPTAADACKRQSYDFAYPFAGTLNAITSTGEKVYAIAWLSEAPNSNIHRWKLIEIDPSNDEVETMDINLKADQLDNGSTVQCMTSNKSRIYVVINLNLHCLTLTGKEHWTFRFLDHTYKPKSITADPKGNIFALVYNTTTGENNVIKVKHDGAGSKILFNDFEEQGMKNPVSLFFENITGVLSVCDEDRKLLVFKLSN